MDNIKLKKIGFLVIFVFVLFSSCKKNINKTFQINVWSEITLKQLINLCGPENDFLTETLNPKLLHENLIFNSNLDYIRFRLDYRNEALKKLTNEFLKSEIETILRVEEYYTAKNSVIFFTIKNGGKINIIIVPKKERIKILEKKEDLEKYDTNCVLELNNNTISGFTIVTDFINNIPEIKHIGIF